MLFIERGDGDNFRFYREGCLQGCFIVFVIDFVSRIVVVLGSDVGVNVVRFYVGNEYEVVGVVKVFYSFLVLMGGVEGEIIGGKVGVYIIKFGSQDVMGVVFFYQQCNEDFIIGGVAD